MMNLNLEAVSDLVQEGATGMWRSTGHDPQFFLRFPDATSRFPAGWARLDIEIEFRENVRRPRLYWDSGDGFTERESMLLPYPVDGRCSRFAYFHRPLHGLRLDPADCESVFCIGRVRLQPMSRASAVLAAIGPYLLRAVGRPRLYAAFLRDAAALWWLQGKEPLRGAIRELLATQSGAALRQYVAAQLVSARRVAEAQSGVHLGKALGGTRLGRAGGRRRLRIGIGLVEHFGDIVACEPVARQLRAEYPDAEICWVVREVFRELIDTNPAVDTTIAVDCLTDWIKWRAHGAFDKVVDLHVNQRICQHCGIALDKREGNPAITGDNHFNYGGLLKAFSLSAGLAPQERAPQVYIPEEAVQAVDALGLPARFVAVHARSNNPDKDWDYPRWTALARELAARGIPVVELGLAPAITDPAVPVINLCGRTSILQMAEVIRRAAVFVGVDSGPAHLANATGTRGVVLLGQFGPFKSYNPFSGTYGAGQRVTLVRNDTGPAALIESDRVAAALLQALGEGTAPQPPVSVAGDARPPAPAAARDVDPRVIAFYLPQYHPIPLNDRAWGKGFTEWRNVGRSRAYFEGQYQPRLPGELGYYDLRVPQIMDQQAELARAHGIDAFCYYYYWFNGMRLLNLPLDNMLQRRRPDFPFCFCWANENWTRRWDGMDKEVLAAQNHTPEDDLAFLRFIMPALEDPRYVRVNGKPLLLVYRTELFPDPRATAERWREASIRAGIGDLFLVRCEGFDPWTSPDSIGFDASYEVPTFILPDELKVANLAPLKVAPEFKGRIYDYPRIVDFYCNRPDPPYRRYRGPMLAWDNTPRHAERAVVFHNVTPQEFERWMSDSLAHARRRFAGQERLLFVNAWNEWAEGSYLEPDLRYGRSFLEAVARAVRDQRLAVPPGPLLAAAAE